MTMPIDTTPIGAPSATPAPEWSTTLEQLARDLLKDRRSQRRWRFLSRFLWLALAAAVVWFWWGDNRRAALPNGPHTALVEVRGEISADSEASAEVLISALKQAFEDEGSQAVVMRFNSPGGSPVQAGMVYDEVVRLKALHNKKVYAVVEETCASAAYYMAVSADEIYANKASVVGSIGVLMDGFGFTGVMQKLGVERRLLTSGENKAMGDPFTPLSDKHRAYTQAMLTQIHQQFIDVVKEGRGDRLKKSPLLFTGLYWNGEDAVKLGLIDGLGSLDFVARNLANAPDVIDYTPKDNVAERLAKRFGASVGSASVKALRGLGNVR
jgi:protease IV